MSIYRSKVRILNGEFSNTNFLKYLLEHFRPYLGRAESLLIILNGI